MSVIVKGVYDITYSIVSTVAYVLLRDLTNYYWYYDEARQQNDEEEGSNLNSNDEVCDRLESTQENDSKVDSFCTSLNSEVSVPNISEMNIIEDNVDNFLVQNYEGIIQKDVNNDINYSTNLETVVEQPLDETTDACIETQCIEDNAAQNHDEDFNFLSSNKIENCIWEEIDHFIQSTKDDSLNKNNLNITEKEFSENADKNLPEEIIDTPAENLPEEKEEKIDSSAENLPEKKEEIIDTPAENVDVGSEIEEISIPLIELKNLIESMETGVTLSSNKETGETLVPGECEEKDKVMGSCEKSNENLFMGDSQKSTTALPNDDNSDISSECELGIRNFQLQKLIDECSKVRQPEAPLEKKTDVKRRRSKKSKISRYVGNTTLPKHNKDDSDKMDSSSIDDPKFVSEEIENVNLIPLKYDEITNTQPYLSDLKDITKTESDDASKLTEILDDLSEISRIPAELSDLGSVCSDDSWDNWLGKFAAIMRSKSPMKYPDVSLAETSDSAAEEVPQSDPCDCVNTHCCLLVVDSDDEGSENLLSAEQLGSVETGSSINGDGK